MSAGPAAEPNVDDEAQKQRKQQQQQRGRRGTTKHHRVVALRNEITPRTLHTLAMVARLGGFHDKPMCFVNLVKFRDKALYPDGRHPDWSGARAYQEYMDSVKTILPRVGAKVIFSGVNKGVVIGRISSLWDAMGIVWYPDFLSVMRLLSSPDYLAMSAHRFAGLEGELDILTIETDDISSSVGVLDLEGEREDKGGVVEELLGKL